MKPNIKFYKVAGITFQVISEYPISENTFHPKFKPFEVSGPDVDTVSIHHHFQEPTVDDRGDKNKVAVYKNDQFQIFKSDTAWTYHYTSLSPHDAVNSAIGVMSNDYSSMHIHAQGLTRERYHTGTFSALTLFNTDQMIFAKLLSDRNGVMIHSNGFNINGNGVLLAGISGSGKSTLSGMLKQQGHEILCDDRMLIRRRGNAFRIFGNWCYGSHPDVSASDAPLRGILFLKKGVQNQITEIKEKKTIASRLLQVMVKPLLDIDGWQKYFATIDALKNNVKFFQIEFDLSGNICDIAGAFFKKQ